MTTHPGTVLREEAFTNLDVNDTKDENRLLRTEIICLGLQRDVFSSNDLSDWIRANTHPNRRGRMFAQLAKEGLLTEVGMVKSSNKKAHGKRVSAYRLVSS
jgi:hypothetical protein